GRQREDLLAEADLARDNARTFPLDVVCREPEVMTAVEVIEAVDAGNADAFLEIDVALEANLRADAAVPRIEAHSGRELGERLTADPVFETGRLLGLSRSTRRQHREHDADGDRGEAPGGNGDDVRICGRKERRGDGAVPALLATGNVDST